MNSTAKLILILSILGSVGGWCITLSSWAAATTPVAVGGLFLGVSSTLAAAFGVKTLPTPPIPPEK